MSHGVFIMGRSVSGILLTGGALAAAIMLLTLLPLSTAATTQPQILFRPMDLPTTQCPPNTAQEFEQDDDGPGRLLDETTAAGSYNGTLMVPPVFAGRQAWLILSITSEGTEPDELHELFLTNARGETIFLGVIDEGTFTNTAELVFQIPQDFLTAGTGNNNNTRLQLDEGTANQDPNVITAAHGDITIDSMRVCYGGYYVYHIPLTCGFTPVDLKVAEAPNQNPLISVPAIKQGDYATNIIIHNPDVLRTRNIEATLLVEFALEVNPLGGWTSYYTFTPIPLTSFTIPGLGRLFESCNTLNDEVRNNLSPAPDTNNKVFWKGVLILRQPIGEGIDASKVPISVQAVYSYELTVNKLRYQILRDPSGTIPRHLIGQDLEMLIAVNPLNKTDLGSTPFDSFQTMRVIRENIKTQYPAAADRATIRVIEANVGVGSSQTITRIEPTETPLENPVPPGGG